MLVAAFDWTEFFQQVVSGLASGGIYALLALALVLIFRTTGVANFAQGEMAMFTTFIAWSLIDRGWPYWPAVAATIAIAFVGGIAVERVAVRPLRDAPHLTVVIVTLGLFFIFNGSAFWIWSPELKSMPSAFSRRPVEIAGVAFSIEDLGIIAVSIGIVIVLYLFFQYTKLGLAMRAAALNPDSSRLSGVRVSWMIALGWGLSAALGAIAGLLAAPPLQSFDQNFMQPILLYAFAGAVLGGMDSPAGAVVGSLLFGVMLNLLGTYVDWIGTDLRLPVALFIILLVLLVRPTGLFGRTALRRA